MIFITLGSQKFQFNRLLRAVDDLVEQGAVDEPVYAQTGYSDYKPRFYKYKRFMDHDKFEEAVSRADIVITHGGTGAIIGAVKKGRKVIAVPRLARYGEHVDDHQIQLIEEFTEENLIYGIQSCDELGRAVKEIRGMEFASYKGNSEAIIESIGRYIDGCRK